MSWAGGQCVGERRSGANPPPALPASSGKFILFLGLHLCICNVMKILPDQLTLCQALFRELGYNGDQKGPGRSLGGAHSLVGSQHWLPTHRWGKVPAARAPGGPCPPTVDSRAASPMATSVTRHQGFHQAPRALPLNGHHLGIWTLGPTHIKYETLS